MAHRERKFLAGIAMASCLLIGNATTAAQAVAEPSAKATAKDATAKTEKMAQSGASLDRVTKDIKYLASDELGGRQPGTPEMKLSEDHIVAAYREAGLKDPMGDGSYFQTFEVGQKRNPAADECSVTLSGPNETEMTLELGKDYAQLLNRNNFDISGGLAFVGYGISAEEELNFDEYADLDVKDKMVVLIRREPQQKVESSVFDGTSLTKHSYIASKVAAARKAGAAGILMVNDSITASEDSDDPLVDANNFAGDIGSLPFMHLKRSTLDAILAVTPVFTASGEKLESVSAIEKQIDAELEPLSQTLKGWQVAAKAKFEVSGIPTSNIIGVIEGEGPHAEETIIIGAHYDHLGKGAYGSRARGDQRNMIRNGADDNATGTAAVMELARRFAARDKKPARRLVFICFTAEEMGLLGAYHYVQNPIYPLEKTVAMINFDMIGWLREDKVTLFGWNSSRSFGPMFDAANTDLNLDLIKPEAGFAGSDHLPFNEKEIPNTFLNTGLTSTYHTPDDDFETIDCAGAVKVIDFTEAFIDELANAKQAPRYTYTGPFRLGVNVLPNEDGLLQIAKVADGSIAEASGLREFDVILAWGDDEISTRRDLRRLIRRDKGKTIELVVERDGEEVKIPLKLARPDEEDEA
jgi:hypothetical protein